MTIKEFLTQVRYEYPSADLALTTDGNILVTIGKAELGKLETVCWISNYAKNFSVNAGLSKTRSLNALKKLEQTEPVDRKASELWG